MMEWITTHIIESAALVILGGSAFIQIAPIKVNPWSSLARKIGKAVNRDIMVAVNEIKAQMEDHVEQDAERTKLEDERFIKQCRLRILRFNDEILQGQPHTKEHYDEILDDITEYNRYCRLHPEYENSKAVIAIRNTESRYQKHLAEKTFL